MDALLRAGNLSQLPSCRRRNSAENSVPGELSANQKLCLRLQFATPVDQGTISEQPVLRQVAIETDRFEWLDERVALLASTEIWAG
jgi:hypothetical protein